MGDLMSYIVLFPCCFVMRASSSLRRALMFCKTKQNGEGTLKVRQEHVCDNVKS